MINNSFVIMSDDELMHWKYIKREKVGGKWVYTYADDMKKANAATKKADYKNAVNIKQTWNKQAQAARVKNIANVEGSDKPSATFRSLVEGSREHDAWMDAELSKHDYKTTAAGRKEQRQANLKAAIEKRVRDAKELIRDALGGAAKDAAKSADMKAKLAAYDYADEVKENQEYLKKAGYVHDNTKQLMSDVERHKRMDAAKAKQEAERLVAAYEKTPLAKLEKMKERIESAKKWKEFSDAHTPKVTKRETKDTDKVLSSTTRVSTAGDGVHEIYNRGKLDQYLDERREKKNKRK